MITLSVLALVLATFLPSVLLAQCVTSSWGYTIWNGPQTECWDIECAEGFSQSPINIPYYREMEIIRHELPIRWVNYREKQHGLKMSNNGRTAEIRVPRRCQGKPKVFNGGLNSTFELETIQFHWGSKHKKGSEHIAQGERYDAEIHFIHVNEKCGRSYEEAIANECQTDEDAFAILAVFIQADRDQDNLAFKPIIQALRHITHQGEEAWLSPFKLTDLLPQELNKFYRYSGSFTQPSCEESVIWTVFKEPIQISRDQLSRFFNLKTDTGRKLRDPLINNFRPIQPSNDRLVAFYDLKLECESKAWHTDSICSIKYKESGKEMSFSEATHFCIGFEFDDTPLIGLISVGKLRCLRNNYGYSSNKTNVQLCARYFRVNAMKDSSGQWKEYPSGSWINFHHFPEFKADQGRSGDTLVWDALENRLLTAKSHEKHSALCYKADEKASYSCAGKSTGHECGDAGDCTADSLCQCDAGFTGFSCQVPALPSLDIISIGQSGYASRFISVQGKTDGAACQIPSFASINPAAQRGMLCDFIFGRALCCGGHEDLDDAGNLSGSNTNICGMLDCSSQSWLRINDFPADLYFEAATVVKRHGEDLGWLVSGGEANVSNVMTAQTNMFWLDHEWNWQMMETQMPNPRAGHCMTQINEWEVAFIGGADTFWYDDFSAAGNFLKTIDIYNIETNTWRAGPDLLEDMLLPGCVRIKDRTTNNLKVLIGCGVNSQSMQIWDLSSNEIKSCGFECPNSADSGATINQVKFKEINDQISLMINNIDVAYIFDEESGFTEYFTENPLHYGGDTIVAPGGCVDCSSFLLR